MEKTNSSPSFEVPSRAVALDDLVGIVCKGCGAEKQRRKSHCRDCYFSLPRRLQRTLYNRVGEGYEEAYGESLAVLRMMKENG